MKTLLALLLAMTSLVAVAAQSVPSELSETVNRASTPMTNPVEQRQRMFDALLRSDMVALLETNEGEEGLKSFLLQGRGNEDEAKIRARIAEKAARGETDEFERHFTRLLDEDGVEHAMREWYPQWQKQVPHTLVMIQGGLLAMASAIAEGKDLTPLERSQLTDLQWALSGWLARTDLADRKNFEKVVREVRALALATGVTNVELLAFIEPQQRIDLANKAMDSAKNIAALYGIDARAILASAKVELLQQDGDKARIRTTLNVLGAEVGVEEDLVWRERWVDARRVEAERARAEVEAEREAESVDPPDSEFEAEWERNILEPAPEPLERPSVIKTGGCSAPE